MALSLLDGCYYKKIPSAGYTFLQQLATHILLRNG
jgi:predicted aconitase